MTSAMRVPTLFFAFLLCLVMPAALAAQEIKIDLDMRKWTIAQAPGPHGKLQLAEKAATLSVATIGNSARAVIASPRFKVAQGGSYLLHLGGATNRSLSASIADIESVRLRGAASRRLRGYRPPIRADGFGAIPSTLVSLSPGDNYEVFLDLHVVSRGEASASKPMELRVPGLRLTKVDVPLMHAVWLRWSRGRSTVDVSIESPRLRGRNFYFAFASAMRRAKPVPIPGLLGAGLWLDKPVLLLESPSTRIAQIEFARVPFARLPKLHWQVVHVNVATSSMRVATGSSTFLDGLAFSR